MKPTLLISALVGISVVGCAPQPSIAASTQVSQGRSEDAKSQEGIQKLQQAADIAWSHYYKAEKLFKQGFLADAESETLEAMKLMPKLFGSEREEPALLRMLAAIRFEQGRKQDGLAILKKGIAPDGTVQNDLLKRDLALAFAINGDITNAKKYFDDKELIRRVKKEGLAEIPNSENVLGMTTKILFSIGLDYRGESNDEEAVRYFRKANANIPSNGLIAFYAAETEQHLGRRVAALTIYKTLPETSSKFQKAKQNLETLERLKKQNPVEFEKIPPLPSERDAKKGTSE